MGQLGQTIHGDQCDDALRSGAKAQEGVRRRRGLHTAAGPGNTGQIQRWSTTLIKPDVIAVSRLGQAEVEVAAGV